MNRRQHKKTMCSLVAKIAAQATYPELNLKSTRAERKLFRKERETVKTLVDYTLKEV